MFTGMDEVDWASLRHAYGSAEDVPGLLRGLASTDPVERETALDGMYGAVHHQGDVYDSTLACVPFLLALVASGQVADRAGIVELVVSIGAESEGPDSGVESVLCTRAQVGVRAGCRGLRPADGGRRPLRPPGRPGSTRQVPRRTGPGARPVA